MESLLWLDAIMNPLLLINSLLQRKSLTSGHISIFPGAKCEFVRVQMINLWKTNNRKVQVNSKEAKYKYHIYVFPCSVFSLAEKYSLITGLQVFLRLQTLLISMITICWLFSVFVSPYSLYPKDRSPMEVWTTPVQMNYRPCLVMFLFSTKPKRQPRFVLVLYLTYVQTIP